VPADLAVATAQTSAKTSQDALSAGALDEMAILWKLLDPLHVVSSTSDWLQQTLGLVNRWWKKSSDQAVTDYNTVRALVTGDLAPFRPVLPAPVDLDTLTQDLLITGPGTVLHQQKLGRKPEQAMTTGFVTTSETVNTAVLAGGRDTTLAAIAQDPQARYGATRIARPDACGFCKMLQANTYTKAHVGFAAHGLCRCVPGPVFRIGQPIPKLQRDMQELWATSTKGLYGKAALSKFRAEVEGREWNGYTSKPNKKGVITKTAPDGRVTAWRDGKQLSGRGPRPERKSPTASAASAVPDDASLRAQYSAEHAALSTTVGSTKSDAARKYQTDRIAQLERMLSLL
jgi:hypothetical protein